MNDTDLLAKCASIAGYSVVERDLTYNEMKFIEVALRKRLIYPAIIVGNMVTYRTTIDRS